MQKCSTGDGHRGSINVTLCHSCYENPPPAYASLVSASKEPPDDFDIPVDFDIPDILRLAPRVPAWLTAPKGRWITKRGDLLRFRDIDNGHLENIVRMILRIRSQMESSGYQGENRVLLERKLLQARTEQGRRQIENSR